MIFELAASDGLARTGRLVFGRGTVRTPAFMPVGTYGTVKAMTPEEVAGIGSDIVLANTFHLMLRPGTEIIRKHGDLHDFIDQFQLDYGTFHDEIYRTWFGATELAETG